MIQRKKDEKQTKLSINRKATEQLLLPNDSQELQETAQLIIDHHFDNNRFINDYQQGQQYQYEFLISESCNIFINPVELID